ncbi:MAG: winged helix-turn-helix domain-containing protein [archaeon]
MANSDKIISMDLNDSRMKYISEIFGSESCKKILNLLAEKELTETDIAKELKMPLNSVDYNVKKLVQAGLIESGSHFWSVRGKRMPSYRVSDKKIVISPKRMSSSVLLIPALLVGGLISLTVRKLVELNSYVPEVNLMMAKSGVEDSISAVQTTAGVAMTGLQDSVAERAADAVMTSAPTVAEKTSFIGSIVGWEWFLIGIWSGILIFFLLNYIFERRYK